MPSDPQFRPVISSTKKERMTLPGELTFIEKLRLILKLKDKTMIEKLKSRKFLVAVLGGAVVAAGSFLGMPDEITSKLVALLSAYIIGQSAVDAAAALKK